MRWTVARLDEFVYLRVSRTGEVIGTLTGVSGGSISENLNTALKVSGTLDVVDTDIADDRVRIIARCDEGGGPEDVVLGTFLASTPAREVSGSHSRARVELYSTLLVLDEDRVETTYTVPAATNAVALAVSLAQGAGLAVVSTASSAPTTTAATFEAGTSKLSIINNMLTYAGYGSAGVDPYGAVVMSPYTSPAVRGAAWTFSDGDESIFAPKVTDEHDWYDTPNVVALTATNADAVLIATAVNADPLSPYSTVSRGRRIVRAESVSDVESQAALQARADRLLEESSTNVQSETVTHSYAPFTIGDVVRLAYRAAGLDYAMVVQSREVRLSPGMPTTTRMRRFVRG